MLSDGPNQHETDIIKKCISTRPLQYTKEGDIPSVIQSGNVDISLSHISERS